MYYNYVCFENNFVENVILAEKMCFLLLIYMQKQRTLLILVQISKIYCEFVCSIIKSFIAN